MSTSPAPLPDGSRFSIAAGLRAALADGYRAADFRKDVVAGLVVAIVALPLSMALAIATGVAPQHGLYTAIIAGAVVALTGGARTSVTGPTAAFVVVLVPIGAEHGIGGLLMATTMAGILLTFLGLTRLGRLVQFIPHPVTTGFTAGIATVIAVMQIPDFLGIQGVHGEHFHDRVFSMIRGSPGIHAPDAIVGIATLAVLIVMPKITKKIPAPLVALLFGGLLGWGLGEFAGLTPDTIGARFGGIPGRPPSFEFPWNMPGADGKPVGLSMDLFRDLSGAALAIGLLAAIESLLCAVVADGITGKKHDPDGELVGLGIGNLVVPFFGGFAATGAIARTATNIRAGGRSPIAAVFHSGFVLLFMIALAPLLSRLPMASLAALLLIVAWNMSEVRHAIHIVRVAPRSDALVLGVCFGLTVFIDMVAAVTVGVLLAAMLFMKRMASLTEVRLSNGAHPALRDFPLPEGVLLYEVAGALFFGAAEKALGALARVAEAPRAVVLYLEAVPVMDGTALVALESAVNKLEARGVPVVLAGVRKQPLEILKRAGIGSKPGRGIFPNLDQAAAWLHLVLPDLAPPAPISS